MEGPAAGQEIFVGYIQKIVLKDINMRIKEGFVLRTMLGEHVVVGEGLAQVNFNRLLSLNSTAAYLWESVVGKDFTVEDLAQLILDKYDVSQEQALADSDSITKTWIEQGVLLP